MMDTASKYVAEHKISFSTNPNPIKSKTKGIVFSERKLRFEPVTVKLDGVPLPWVENSKYLGNKLTSEMNGFSSDIREKRARFIERNCELNQEFSFAHPEVKTKLNRIYNRSFPGSVLWDMTSSNAKMIVNSWSVAVRHMWNLPLNAHRYLIEQLSGTHARTMLICQYVKFLRSIKKSPKLAVQLLFQKLCANVNTVTGRNIRYVLDATNYESVEDIDLSKVKKNMKFCEVEEHDVWKGDFIKEMVNVKHNVLSICDSSFFEDEELDFIIDYLSTS